MGKTRIEWTERTWNPVTGCSRVSPGCAHCYAERMAKRLAGRCGYPEAPHEFDVTLHQDRLSEPLKWQSPQRVFVVSMGDLFHEVVPFSYIAQVFGIMAVTPQHTYQILTKRAYRMKEFFDWGRYHYAFCHVKTLRNVWLGVTAENQEQADQRVPVLLQTPAAVRFVSVEPMLSHVYLTSLQCERLKWDALTGYQYQIENSGSQYNWQAGTAQLDWVICGGESGPGARPLHPDWVRTLRNQCQAAKVPFFFKQWGDNPDPAAFETPLVNAVMQQKRHWRMLDGRVWEEFPVVGDKEQADGQR